MNNPNLLTCINSSNVLVSLDLLIIKKALTLKDIPVNSGETFQLSLSVSLFLSVSDSLTVCWLVWLDQKV